MAEIFLASAQGPEGFSKDVVIKVVRSFLLADQQFIQMFIAEARLASRLNHANVVQIFDFGKHEDSYYLAMEYVRGASLWDLRKRCHELGTPFPPTLAAEICAQVARGLQYAHALSEGGQRIGVVHRDVTPHNVLLSFDGAVKLTDFGIAKATSSHTAPGMLKGKFAYMSPEQARGEKVDARTDVFALGVVLWEMLTGGRLFDGDSDVAILRAVTDSLIAPPARLNPDVPQDLSDIVMKALARPVEERFQTAFELEKALANWVLRSAKSVDDTSVASFLQQLFREEYEAGLRSPGTPAAGVSAVSSMTPMPDDFGEGGTMAVDRAQQHASGRYPEKTMTSTPVKPMPDRATPNRLPARRGVMDDEDAPPSRTEEMVGLDGAAPLPPRKNTDEMPAVRAPVRTEQMPAHRPSRRFDPLPVSEPSVVVRSDVSRAPEQSQPSQPSVTESVTQTQPDDAIVAAPRSKAPLAIAGLALVAIAGGVTYAVMSAASSHVEAPPAVTIDKPAEPVVPKPEQRPPEPPAVVAAADASVEAADAGEAAPLVEVEKDAGVAPIAGGEREPKTPVAAPKKVGTLMVKAVPFAVVSANGRDLGEVMGTKSFKLPARSYELVLKRNQVKKTTKVSIKPNETVSISFDEL